MIFANQMVDLQRNDRRKIVQFNEYVLDGAVFNMANADGSVTPDDYIYTPTRDHEYIYHIAIFLADNGGTRWAANEIGDAGAKFVNGFQMRKENDYGKSWNYTLGANIAQNSGWIVSMPENDLDGLFGIGTDHFLIGHWRARILQRLITLERSQGDRLVIRHNDDVTAFNLAYFVAYIKGFYLDEY